MAKALKIAGIVSGILAAVWAVLAWGPWVSLFWSMKVEPVLSKIIPGGATYETVEMVVTTGQASVSWLDYAVFGIELAMPLILAAVSIACFLIRRKLLKKGESHE
ncbi:MAG TPA: hypothetical protein IAC82_04405 [Candidatus Merdivicinus intestinigallinarum]|nr:hypothetical protein [Candidatus Merdivicinus intestinigallinarum]